MEKEEESDQGRCFGNRGPEMRTTAEKRGGGPAGQTRFHKGGPGRTSGAEVKTLQGASTVAQWIRPPPSYQSTGSSPVCSASRTAP